MLPRKRDVTRVGRDGNDEVVTAQFSEASYVHLAREILHRIRPVDELLPGCDASNCGHEVELMSDFNLNFLMKLCAGASPEDLDAVSLLNSPKSLSGNIKLTSPVRGCCVVH